MAKDSFFLTIVKKVIVFYLVVIFLVALLEMAVELLEVLLQMWQTYVALSILSILAYLRLFGFRSAESESTQGIERTPYGPAFNLKERE